MAKLTNSVEPLKNDNTTVYRPEQVQSIMKKPLLPSQVQKTDLFKTNKIAYVDSVLQANMNKEWVKRLVEKQTTANSIQDPYSSGYRSTHLMAHDGKGYVYPQVIMQNGKLIHFPTEYDMNEDQAIEYAKKNNIGIQLPQDQGAWFAENGYKIGTNVNNDIDSKTGIPYHTTFKLK